MILVSACLAGFRCRYDGRRSSWPGLADAAKDGWAAICPEQLGGLTTPRLPARIQSGFGADVLNGECRVLAADGSDVTGAYLAGARAALWIAQRLGPTAIYLKDRSPSCAAGEFRDKQNRPCGPGVAAAALVRAGFRVVEVKARADD